MLLIASQAYWFWQGHVWAKARIRSRAVRRIVESAALVLYFIAAGYNFGLFGPRRSPTHLTPGEALLAGPFEWWLASSIAAFLIALVFLAARLVARALRARTAEASPGRRQFLERTATVAVAVPFVAGAYGALYGRLNLQTTSPRIQLPNLPGAFHGFRIAQLSDIHIGPFMTASRIRDYAQLTNALKPDLIVLTGDFVTWDPSTQQAVVSALSGLKAPFGVFGSLGNHESWTRTQASITRLFKEAGIRILRQERTSVQSGGESLNLIGIDFSGAWARGPDPGAEHDSMSAVPHLMIPGQVNILMSHNPATFDRAARLGVDLSLAGHTHGGQVALEFISPEIAPSRLITPYVAGHFVKPGAQLYVNRGIGTIGVPIRLGAPPEISVFELARGGEVQA